MQESPPASPREVRVASVLRSLGRGPLRHEEAVRAGRLLGLHWTTIYRMRARFLRDPVTSSLKPDPRGRGGEPRRLAAEVEAVVADVVERWLPSQCEVAHPVLDAHMEVRRRCRELDLRAPARNTVDQRMKVHRDAELALLASRPGAAIPPGSFGAAWPLELVEIDHTQADVVVVDRFTRRPLGRPWISVAIDLATRTVPAFFVGMERPSASTVALLVSRVVQPKQAWLAHLELEIDWPMCGIPRCLHLDNAAEFRSRALRSGCAQYGIELEYRPVGRPNYGGHIERLNRTLMQRLKGLPGSTGNSPRERKARQPEERARLSLHEFERWLALEIGQRYHHSEHRGLHGGTPHGAWSQLAAARAPRQLAAGPDEVMKLLIHFMPLASRSVQRDGLAIFYIRYWHPVFIVWREQRRQVRVRYHPEDLSRIFVSADGRNYLEARYADLRRPSITLWEQRAAVRWLRGNHDARLSEELVFRAIGQQREIVQKARQATLRVRREVGPVTPDTARPPVYGAQSQDSDTKPDYDTPAQPYPAEVWT